MHYREILFTPRCSPRAREFPGSTFLYDVRLRSYRASKLPNFWIFPNFVYFPHTKRRNVPSGDRRMITIFACGSRRSKGLPSGSGVFLRLRGPPNLSKFSPMANGYTLTECYYTVHMIWTKDVWKRVVLRTDVLSHQISSRPRLRPHTSKDKIKVVNLQMTA